MPVVELQVWSPLPLCGIMDICGGTTHPLFNKKHIFTLANVAAPHAVSLDIEGYKTRTGIYSTENVNALVGVLLVTERSAFRTSHDLGIFVATIHWAIRTRSRALDMCEPHTLNIRKCCDFTTDSKIRINISSERKL